MNTLYDTARQIAHDIITRDLVLIRDGVGQYNNVIALYGSILEVPRFSLLTLVGWEQYLGAISNHEEASDHVTNLFLDIGLQIHTSLNLEVEDGFNTLVLAMQKSVQGLANSSYITDDIADRLLPDTLEDIIIFTAYIVHDAIKQILLSVTLGNLVGT